MSKRMVLVGDSNLNQFSAGCQPLEPDKMKTEQIPGILGMGDIERIESALGEVRGEMKELREAVTGLVRVDEKVANLITLSEKNSEVLDALRTAVWKRFGNLNDDLTALKEARAADRAAGEVYGKLLWPMFGGVIAIMATVVGAAFLV